MLTAQTLISVPVPALACGFVNSPVGTHGSRTLMLADLRTLLVSRPAVAAIEDYRDAIVEDNVLLKNTLTTRREAFRRLRELYALSPDVLLFSSLRDLWDSDEEAQPLLALLCASARDIILRGTADAILSAQIGNHVTPQLIAAAAEQALPGRYNSTSLANIGRHAASSWQQSGHLAGRATKTRVQVPVQPAAAAYAFFLAYLCGDRGEGIFDSLWSCLLDRSPADLHDLAFAAAQRGFMEYRHSGTVTEVGFRHLLGAETGT